MVLRGEQNTIDGFSMTKLLTTLPLVAALAIGTPAAVLAQTVTVETDETVAQEQSVDDQLSLGEETETEVGKPYTAETIGAWEMRCIKVEEGEDPCQMYQLMQDDEGAPVAEISLFRLPDGGKAKAGATVIVPLETALPQQMTLSIDGGKARRYPYAFCNSVGCYVRMGLTDDDVNAFKRGNEAKITIIPALAPDQKVIVSLSLEGFTASYGKVAVLNQ